MSAPTLNETPAVFRVPSLDPMPVDADEMVQLYGGLGSADAAWRVIACELVVNHEVHGKDIGGASGTRRQPTIAELRAGLERFAAALVDLRVHVLKSDGAAVNRAVTAARRVYASLDGWTEAHLYSVCRITARNLSAELLIPRLDAVLVALKDYRPDHRKARADAVPVGMITQLAKLYVEAGGRLTRSGWAEDEAGGGVASDFERVVELARIYGGFDENERGDVRSWLRHVLTAEFCRGWNGWGDAVRAARAKAIA